MRARSEERIAGLQWVPANERFKRGFGNVLSLAVVVSAGLHYALFNFFPSLRAADLGTVGDEIAAIDLPPEVRIPPPPEQIARPATPRVSAAADIDEDITIAPTTFEQNPVENLPPPPTDGAVDVRDKPVYIARDVEPRLKNGDEIQRLLKKFYPPMLREAGIGGRVVLWVFVEESGTAGACQVHSSSGFPALDQAAERVAEQMVFRPAMSRDRPVGVWIAQPIDFRVQAG
ncbi:MAG: energy transducer TonB [Gemmatimonadota bacterium]|nr:energy transducer TonB [Gemmatimonadota bacterium]